jgi:hypothetical protein
VFSENELFLGQIGQAYAFVWHPSEEEFHAPADAGAPADASAPLELFPHRDRLLIPVGGTLPPMIHIGYTPLTTASTLFLTTRSVAEAQAREHWLPVLSASKPGDDATDKARATERPREMVADIIKVLAGSGISGSAILIHCLPKASDDTASQAARGFLSLRRRESKPRAKSGVIIASQPTQSRATPIRSTTGESISASPAIQQASSASSHGDKSIAEPDTRAPLRLPQLFKRTRTQTTDEGTPDSVAVATLVETEEAQAEAPSRPKARLSFGWILSALSLRDLRHVLAERRRARRAQRQASQAEREQLRRAVQSLLPGQVEGVSVAKPRVPPKERTFVMGGVTLGVLLLVFFLALSTYLQFGGPSRAQSMLDEVKTARNAAFASQEGEDWRYTLTLADQILTLDPQNAQAQKYRNEAQLAIDALENAAVLDAKPLLELGPAPTPRNLLVAQSWIYVLNTATDEVIGLPLDGTGLSVTSDAPVTIIKRGQSFFGETVNHLVAIAWASSGAGYPEGVLFIYADAPSPGEGGYLYIYEPSLGPSSITRQQLQGELGAGEVTLIATYGSQLYLVQRHANQIFKYVPINGLYDTPPRPYFAEGTAPPLRTVLDIAIDGRIYLLFGHGALEAYYEGTPDPAFTIQGLPDPDLHPTVMVIEKSPETGRIYLGDPQKERIVVLDKRGHFLHQFRLPGEALQQLESLAIDEARHVLYLVTENRLYAASLPEFVSGD